MSLALARTGQARRARCWLAAPKQSEGGLFDNFIGELAAARERLHSGGMADKSAVAIVAIVIFLMVGAIVAVGILGTILMFLYGIVVLVFRNVFGIELPHLI